MKYALLFLLLTMGSAIAAQFKLKDSEDFNNPLSLSKSDRLITSVILTQNTDGDPDFEKFYLDITLDDFKLFAIMNLSYAEASYIRWAIERVDVDLICEESNETFRPRKMLRGTFSVCKGYRLEYYPKFEPDNFEAAILQSANAQRRSNPNVVYFADYSLLNEEDPSREHQRGFWLESGKNEIGIAPTSFGLVKADMFFFSFQDSQGTKLLIPNLSRLDTIYLKRDLKYKREPKSNLAMNDTTFSCAYISGNKTSLYEMNGQTYTVCDLNFYLHSEHMYFRGIFY